MSTKIPTANDTLPEDIIEEQKTIIKCQVSDNNSNDFTTKAKILFNEASNKCGVENEVGPEIEHSVNLESKLPNISNSTCEPVCVPVIREQENTTQILTETKCDAIKPTTLVSIKCKSNNESCKKSDTEVESTSVFYNSENKKSTEHTINKLSNEILVEHEIDAKSILFVENDLSSSVSSRISNENASKETLSILMQQPDNNASNENQSESPAVSTELNFQRVADGNTSGVEPVDIGPTVIDGTVMRLVPERVQALLRAILSLQSPDDLQVHSSASQLRTIDNEPDFRWLCEGICTGGTSDRRVASVVGAVCREAATHTVGATKLRSMLFKKAQQLYTDHEELASNDHEKFVICTLFLGEIFYYVRSETGKPFSILAEPLVTMLNKILKKYLELPSLHNHLSCCTACCERHLLCSTCSEPICRPDSAAIAADDTVTATVAAVVPNDGSGCGSDINKSNELSSSNSHDCVDSYAKKIINQNLTSEINFPKKEIQNINSPEKAKTSASESFKLNSSLNNIGIKIHKCSYNAANTDSESAINAEGPALKKCLDSDVMVVAKQLLQSGEWLQRCSPEGVATLVRSLTELLCCCCLSTTASLQVCAALSEMWPLLCSTVHPRTCHAVLAAKLGVSLKI